LNLLSLGIESYVKDNLNEETNTLFDKLKIRKTIVPKEPIYTLFYDDEKGESFKNEDELFSVFYRFGNRKLIILINKIFMKQLPKISFNIKF